MNATAYRAARAALVLLLTGSFTTSAVVFTTDTFIGASNTNYEGAEIVVSNCRLTIDGAHSFARLELQPGSELTHSPGVPGLRLTVSGDVTISTSARVNLDAKGFLGGGGPGLGQSGGTPPSGSGASHGGLGGKSAGGATSPALVGSYTSATAMGASGGRGSGGVGGNGGGAIHLQAGGILRVDGLISAGGGDAVNARAGGGAGGSISISASAFFGSGVIKADGGRGEPSEGGGGSGGRIVIQTGTNLYVGRFSAVGGAGYEWGGPGTIWQQPRNLQQPGELIIDNADRPGRTILSVSFPIEVDLGGGVHARVGSHLAAARLHMRSNSWLTFSNKTYIFVEREAVLDQGSGIIADAAASPGEVPGLGGTYFGAYGVVGGGGGHGGYGGNGSTTNARGGTAYGNVANPTSTGSAGGGQFGAGGAGGGAITIDVTGTFICNGYISANGGDAIDLGGGGGSGGGVSIKAGILAGAGEIRANGGDGSTGLYAGGGGGGGRIAVETGTNIFLGKMTAYGGHGGRAGGAGTIFTSSKNLGFAHRLIADNGGKVGTNTTWTPTGVMDLVIRGGARLRPTSSTSLLFGNLEIGSNSWLELGRYGMTQWPYPVSLSGGARIEVGGGISADGAGYPAGYGAGAGRGDHHRAAAGGGGYGGRGGAGGTVPSTETAGGNSYGSLFSPGGVGSGGGTLSGPTGGSGGGSIILSVAGTLLLDGLISADGLAATGIGGGGGSGGTVKLIVGTLVGRGLISANGGAGWGLGGGGGGGRIAITATANAFSGQWTAFGGAGYNRGGAGTIFVESTGSSREDLLVIDNAGYAGTNTPLSSVTPMRLLVAGGASAWLSGQQVSLNALRVGPGAALRITNSYVYINGDVVVEQGGAIISDGAGHAAGKGTGAGKYHQAVQAADGGGYGGLGVGVGGTVSGGSAYGQINSPRDLGSGGGSSGTVQGSGGAGGGAVALNVTGALVVNGLISANGSPASAPGSGGGSGGSIFLTANSLSGSGLITANAGDGSGRGGGGGGGRISIATYASAFTGSIAALGGRGGGSWGGAGTIYLGGRGRAAPLVQIDNGSHAGFPTLLTPVSVRYDLSVLSGGIAAAPSLTLSNLFIGPGAALTSSQYGTNNFSVEGNATVAAGGRISVNGRGYGPNIGPGRGALENMVGSGAGHGGIGGASSFSPGGAAYGLAKSPAEPGSGGGAVGIGTGSEGGGALRLRVGGTLVVDGEITADGNDGLVDGAGGGAGGSVWIDAQVFYGTGLIASRGGAGEPWLGGGGGGGRIAIYSPNQLFRGIVSVSGGSGFEPGNEGSVFYSGMRVLPLIVIGHIPSENLAQPVSAVEIVFNTPLRQETLSLARPTLSTPGGSETNLVVTLAASDRLRVSFPAQSAEGVYTLLLPPAVQNEFGEVTASTYAAQFQIVVPGIGVAARASADKLRLTWHGILGNAYQPLSSTNLTHWTVWGPPIPCTNANGTLDLELPLDAAPKKFFKILQVQ